ncbi:hypothetical protein FJZ33_07205 [Candidatus Poribacteria bacterium]|nr:hypothetical protein [Candidatus Poribacteria bacterium]
MNEERKLQLINEIKQIERELYLKRSQLGAAEAMENETDLISLRMASVNESDTEKAFAILIEEIGLLSKGGNSVEDIKKERRG